MHTVRRVANRVIMLYPLGRLGAEEPQIVFQGTAEELFACEDVRIRSFVRGEAGARLKELAAA
jgi:phospholipid/cholesterol/gamma-HCH transport system ATP-binding protein